MPWKASNLMDERIKFIGRVESKQKGKRPIRLPVTSGAPPYLKR